MCRLREKAPIKSTEPRAKINNPVKTLGIRYVSTSGGLADRATGDESGEVGQEMTSGAGGLYPSDVCGLIVL